MSRLDRFVPDFLRADADGVLDRENEDFTVADFASFSGGDDRGDGFFSDFIGHDNLDLHFG